jgi:hypothetical protein
MIPADGIEPGGELHSRISAAHPARRGLGAELVELIPARTLPVYGQREVGGRPTRYPVGDVTLPAVHLVRCLACGALFLPGDVHLAGHHAAHRRPPSWRRRVRVRLYRLTHRVKG